MLDLKIDLMYNRKEVQIFEPLFCYLNFWRQAKLFYKRFICLFYFTKTFGAAPLISAFAKASY